jgi:hypothetical protein
MLYVVTLRTSYLQNNELEGKGDSKILVQLGCLDVSVTHFIVCIVCRPGARDMWCAVCGRNMW